MSAGRLPSSGTRTGLGVFVLNLLATVHVVWFYLARTECYVRLADFEQGHERTPFQYRLLLMAPLRWANQAVLVNSAAARLSGMHAFFPNGVRPEGMVEALIDVLSVMLAGSVATRLYQLTSRQGVLANYVYPLTLLMVASTYAWLTMHAYRFPADLPGLGFFSLGLYLIYTRAHPLLFAALFVPATINRETTLLLLVFFVLAQCSRGERFAWRQCFSAATLRTVLPLLAFWAGWRLWVMHRFQGNPSVAQQHFWLNIGILAVPFVWPQLLSVFAYLLPLVVAGRAQIHDRVLRSWVWALPIWFLFMLRYGVLIEIRIFGELIPYVACVAALVAEEKMVSRLRPAASALPLCGEGAADSNYIRITG